MNTEDYDKGFHEGLVASEFSDRYWLRQYAGMAMQGMISELSWERLGDNFSPEIQPKYGVVAEMAINQAEQLLDEIKRRGQLIESEASNERV